jgi:hypothetical protein
MGSLVLIEAGLVCYDVARIIDDHAFITWDRCKAWRIGGSYHREFDRPAVIWINHASEVSLFWLRRNLQHRDGGLPAVIHNNGSVEYWENGKRVYPSDAFT